MAKKIIVSDDLDISDDPKLVAKVDAMMDPEATEVVPVPEPTPPTNDQSVDAAKADPPPLDIFAGMTSAPPLEAVETPPQPKPVKVKVKTKPASKEAKSAAKTVTAKPAKAKPAEDEPVPVTEEAVEVSVKASSPNEYDDPKTAQAIEEIVTAESDAVLNLVDAAVENENRQQGEVPQKHGHPIFWSLVALICLLAVAMALFLMYPSLGGLLNSLHLKTLFKHL